MTTRQIIADTLSLHASGLVDQSEIFAVLSVRYPQLNAVAREAAVEPPKKYKLVRKPQVARRVFPDDNSRCCARTFHEKEHMDSGIVKVMRDDEANQFGDRCKFKKTGDTQFCKHHVEKHTLGVWGGEYGIKLKTLIKKNEDEQLTEDEDI